MQYSRPVKGQGGRLKFNFVPFMFIGAQWLSNFQFL